MDALEAAITTAPAVGSVGGNFMVDGSTYATGAGLGFAGLDFYIAGRGGVLGDVDAGVVAAAFAFFEPGYVRTQWEMGRAVMAPTAAADVWARCCAAWAEAHVSDDEGLERLGELLDGVVATGRPACAPVFAGWRALPVPIEPKAHVVHQMNALREFRMALHGAAVVASGLTPHQALSHRSPGMVPMFGWPEAADTEGVESLWDAAEHATNVAIAHAYEDLDGSEREELVERISAFAAGLA